MGLNFEITEQGKVVSFDPQDVSQWKQVDVYADAEKREMSDFTFPFIMNRIEENGGFIVSGRACGKRIGVDPRAHEMTVYEDPSAYTLTEFEIEKVFYGEPTSKSIVVREGYCPVVTHNVYQIEYTSDYSGLKNDQTVLLFLIPDGKGHYKPTYYQFPLQEDYAEYSEDYLTEMLDYYRGKESVYKYNEKPLYAGQVELENGESAVVATGFSTRWPKSDLTNQEMLEKFSDNILIQVAARYKIKLWPTGHIKYESTDQPQETMKGYQYWCSPRNYNQ